MKAIYLLILLLSVAFIGTAQSKTDWAKMNLKGAIKTVTEKEYKISNPDENSQTRRSQYTFNNKGYKTEEALYNDDALQYRNINQYNNKGYLIEENTVAGSNTIKRQYEYDAKNLVKKVAIYGAKNALMAITTHKYNETGHLIEINIVNKNNKPNEKYNYQYNSNGLLESEEQCTDTVCRKIEYKYNDKGRKMEQVEFEWHGGQSYQEIYKYDDKGNITEETLLYRGEIQTLLTYIYTYDSNGNWINMREMINDKTYTLTVREIEYY